MIALAFYNLVPLGVALVIGVITGRWIFARRAAPQARTGDSESP